MRCSRLTRPIAIARTPDLARLESRLGYTFQDQRLLLRALTHKSAATDNNERLEFLGDAVLGFLVADMLYGEATAGEDTMTLMRASLVRKETLAQVAREIGLGDFIVLGVGEKRSGGHQRASILADAFEALLGAVHVDGGIEPVRGIVLRLFQQRMRELDPHAIKDPKTSLQEQLQGRGIAIPEYEVVDLTGSEHRRTFTVRCKVAELGLTVEGQGQSRRGAEKAAALAMLERMVDCG